MILLYFSNFTRIRGDHRYPGDSIFFDSSMPHNYYNRTDKDCVSILCMTPKCF